VFENSAKVLLATSPNSKIPVLIQESRVQGLIKGTKQEALFLDLISKDVEVKVGEKVITSGLGGIFPKGILIGEIVEIEIFEDKMFQQITVRPATNLENLEQVFVVE